MDTDEIIQGPLDRFERSPKHLDNAKACIWACAMRLMQAGDPDAPAHISMVGQRIGLPDREVNDAIKNAAKRSHWQPAPAVTEAPDSDVRELVEHTPRAYLGDCPACLAMMSVCGQESLMESHAVANHV
jgi:hypothetical protein